MFFRRFRPIYDSRPDLDVIQTPYEYITQLYSTSFGVAVTAPLQ